MCAALPGCHKRQPAAVRPPAFNPVYQWSERARTVAAGTQVSAVVIPAVHAAAPASGFAAVISRDVLNRDGRVLITKGSPATLAVTTRSGRGLSLALMSVTVNGSRYRTISNAGSGPGVLLAAARDERASATEPRRIRLSGAQIDIPANTALRLRVVAAFRIE